MKISISRSLCRLANEVLGLAVDCFAAGEQNPFVVLVDEKGRRRLVDIKDATGSIGPHLVELARRTVRDVGAERYAIAFDACVDTGGAKRDTAVVEIGERNNPEAYLVGQRYRLTKTRKGFQKLGSPILLAPAEALVMASAAPRTRRRRKAKL